MPAVRHSSSSPQVVFWALTAFIALVSFTGGSSRIDVPGLLLLRPMAVLACALALMTLRANQLAGRGWLFIGLGAAAALILVHLMPLPPAMWQALPGREDIVRSDVLAGLPGQWRPLTLTPNNTWHSVASLAVPFAALLIASQLRRSDLFRLVPLLIGIGALSGLIGLMQATGARSGLLDIYGVGADRGAGGLFANRNHAALLLAMLFPMLAAWVRTHSGHAAHYRVKVWSALIIAGVLCPLILVTGSRSGLLLAVFGLVSAAIIFAFGRTDRTIARPSRRVLLIAAAILLGVALLAFTTFYFARAEAIVRLLDRTTITDSRLDSWPVSQALLMKYLPVGAGAGSFVEIYQIIEPDHQLGPQYWNHAHNDYLEIGITFGVPGFVLLLAGGVAFVWRAVPLWRGSRGRDPEVTVARMASVMILMMGLASLTDYPVRTPMMMTVLAICCLWLVEPARGRTESESSALRGQAAL